MVIHYEEALYQVYGAFLNDVFHWRVMPHDMAKTALLPGLFTCWQTSFCCKLLPNPLFEMTATAIDYSLRHVFNLSVAGRLGRNVRAADLRGRRKSRQMSGLFPHGSRRDAGTPV